MFRLALGSDQDGPRLLEEEADGRRPISCIILLSSGKEKLPHRMKRLFVRTLRSGYGAVLTRAIPALRRITDRGKNINQEAEQEGKADDMPTSLKHKAIKSHQASFCNPKG